MNSVVPIQIRPHLVPFFFRVFEGVEVAYTNRRVKACKIHMNSSIGFILRVSMEKANIPVDAQRFNMYLSISDEEKAQRSAFGRIYKLRSGKNSFLQVPQDVNDKVNDLLEDQFRVTFVGYVEGMLAVGSGIQVKDAIASFMEKYELDEFGMELTSLWRLLNREQKKNAPLSRMQKSSTNQVANYG